jgi:hypothetical protein
MRKLILAALVLASLSAFANSVPIGTLQYIGGNPFQVTITQYWATALTGLPAINGSGPFVPVGNMLFKAGTPGFSACPCFTAGYSVWTPTGKNMFISTGNGTAAHLRQKRQSHAGTLPAWGFACFSRPERQDFLPVHVLRLAIRFGRQLANSFRPERNCCTSTPEPTISCWHHVTTQFSSQSGCCCTPGTIVAFPGNLARADDVIASSSPWSPCVPSNRVPMGARSVNLG